MDTVLAVQYDGGGEDLRDRRQSSETRQHVYVMKFAIHFCVFTDLIPNILKTLPSS
jgi:hypothetical protein